MNTGSSFPDASRMAELVPIQLRPYVRDLSADEIDALALKLLLISVDDELQASVSWSSAAAAWLAPCKNGIAGRADWTPDWSEPGERASKHAAISEAKARQLCASCPMVVACLWSGQDLDKLIDGGEDRGFVSAGLPSHTRSAVRARYAELRFEVRQNPELLHRLEERAEALSLSDLERGNLLPS